MDTGTPMANNEDAAIAANIPLLMDEYYACRPASKPLWAANDHGECGNWVVRRP
jgi:hypothetical protein